MILLTAGFIEMTVLLQKYDNPFILDLFLRYFIHCKGMYILFFQDSSYSIIQKSDKCILGTYNT